jgi:hypothetical protein
MMIQKQQSFQIMLLKVLIVALLLPSLISCTQNKTPTSAESVPKAQEQQELKIITSLYFDKLSQQELKEPVRLSKRINTFVYNYCTSQPPIEGNLFKLLANCRTSCGGYVYVFRQITGFYGIQSRAVYLFNIPFQGNHSMVEIKYGKDKWALFDPTFGTFFTAGGNPSEIPYSLDDLYFNCTPDKLYKHVVQARSIPPEHSSMSIDALYTPRSFKAANMTLSTYLSADAYGNPDKYQYSLLWMNIDMNNDIYQFGGPAKNIREGEEKFLTLTNSLLNDTKPNNHVSYVMSYLGEVEGHTYKNGYRLTHLKKDCVYSVTLYGINYYGPKTANVSLYPHFTDKRAILQHSGIQLIPKGAYTFSMLFRARETNAELVLEVYPNTVNSIRIFGIRVELRHTLKSYTHLPVASSHTKSGIL